jgi:polysaccharide export outer membrane protein
MVENPLRQFFTVLAAGLLCLLFAIPRPAAGEYIIGSGDKLQISVWGSPDFSLTTTVRPDGRITMPAVGEVAAAGLTSQALKKELEKAVAKFVRKPIVTVIVTEITNNKVYISGGAISPGVFSLTGNMTLFRLLCQLPSLEGADLIRAYLMRGDKVLLRNFYPLFMLGKMSDDVVLEANDILYIPTSEMNRVYVVGAVKEPQAVPYRYGLRVLDAILAAGGFDEYAKQSNVVVIRGGKKLSVDIEDLLSGKDVKQNIPVAPGDYVVVKEGIF